MFRDMDSGRIELRYWKFEPILLFLIPFMTVWSGGAIFVCYVVPFLQHDTHPMNYMPMLFGIPEKEVLMSVIAVGKSAQPYFKNPRKPVAEVLKVM